MATVSRRTQAEALDAIAVQMRIANQIEVIRLGTSALDEVDVAAIKTSSTAERQARLNVARAAVRVGLGLEGQP